MKGLSFASDDSGSMTDGDIPADIKDRVEELRQQLIENIAESDEALLEKYLEGGDLSVDEINATLKTGAKNASLIGVMCGSAVKNQGVQPLMDFIVQNMPSPLDRAELGVLDAKTGEPGTVAVSESGPLLAYVFKTIADPYAGKLTLFRVFSGEISSDANVYNATRDTKEKFGNILCIEGKNQSSIDAAVTGDIVAVAKLKETSTGDTLCESGSNVRFKSLTHPKPVTSYAVMAKTRADEDKMASSLHRLMEEDPTLLLEKNEATKEFVLSGVGQVHIDVTAARLKRKFGVEMEMKLPKIAYKETIKGKTKVQGKHKKQSGGRGQFADTWIEIEPLPSGGGFEFVNKIVGGAIPKNYIPAVEKGIANQMADGILAGFPIVDVRVSLVDGGYHDVDSSDMAFQIAGSKGFKLGFAECNPILLEPIMQVEITVPDDLTGDVMGDVNSRRGRVLGMEQAVGGQMVKALVPQSEMLTYSADLTSMTSGRGLFTMEFDHYEELPHNLAEKVIAAAHAEEK
jgi:elongation factor G